MQPDEIKAAISGAITDADVQVSIDGSHVKLIVVSPAFDGKSAVKKQQMVYGALEQAIADGVIHAVHMSTYTPTEWAQHQV
jgi:acid stress-induced BolA-like protein IbaG/YrbA